MCSEAELSGDVTIGISWYIIDTIPYSIYGINNCTCSLVICALKCSTQLKSQSVNDLDMRTPAGYEYVWYFEG